MVELLELRSNNPYSIGQVYVYTNGDVSLDSNEISFDKSANDRFYTTTAGENLTTIAHKAYGDSKLWWVIYQVNPELYSPFELELSPGTVLLIPDAESLETII